VCASSSPSFSLSPPNIAKQDVVLPEIDILGKKKINKEEAQKAIRDYCRCKRGDFKLIPMTSKLAGYT